MASPSDLSVNNYLLIKNLFLLSDDGDRRLLQSFDLSTARFNLLEQLAASESLTAADLCQRLLCDKANVTRLLDGLEGDGLVKRTPDKADGRRTRVTLTAAGRRRWTEAHEAHQASIRERFGRLSLEEASTLQQLLSRLEADLKASLAAA